MSNTSVVYHLHFGAPGQDPQRVWTGLMTSQRAPICVGDPETPEYEPAPFATPEHAEHAARLHGLEEPWHLVAVDVPA